MYFLVQFFSPFGKH